MEKVVSLTAANTEIVYALGAGDLLVGADAYSDYPEEANDLPRMGDYAGPNVELIAAAEADVVLASTKLQQDAIEKMEALGLNVVLSLIHIYVVMEIPKKTFEVIIDEVKEAKGVTEDIELDVNDMKELVSRFKAYYLSLIHI